MNYLDLIIGIILIYAAIKGFCKGFIIEVASLAGLIIGVYAGVLFADIVGLIIEGIIDVNVMPVKVISFIIILVAVAFAVNILAKIIEKVIKIAYLNIFNRIAGVLAGILKATFLLSVILIFVNKLNDKSEFLPEDTRNNSLFYNTVSKFAPAILPDRDFLHIGNPHDWMK